MNAHQFANFKCLQILASHHQFLRFPTIITWNSSRVANRRTLDLKRIHQFLQTQFLLQSTTIKRILNCTVLSSQIQYPLQQLAAVGGFCSEWTLNVQIWLWSWQRCTSHHPRLERLQWRPANFRFWISSTQTVFSLAPRSVIYPFIFIEY
jgi:hypothetical protein